MCQEKEKLRSVRAKSLVDSRETTNHKNIITVCLVQTLIFQTL